MYLGYYFLIQLRKWIEISIYFLPHPQKTPTQNQADEKSYIPIDWNPPDFFFFLFCSVNHFLVSWSSWLESESASSLSCFVRIGFTLTVWYKCMCEKCYLTKLFSYCLWISYFMQIARYYRKFPKFALFNEKSENIKLLHYISSQLFVKWKPDFKKMQGIILLN